MPRNSNRFPSPRFGDAHDVMHAGLDHRLTCSVNELTTHPLRIVSLTTRTYHTHTCTRDLSRTVFFPIPISGARTRVRKDFWYNPKSDVQGNPDDSEDFDVGEKGPWYTVHTGHLQRIVLKELIRAYPCSASTPNKGCVQTQAIALSAGLSQTRRPFPANATRCTGVADHLFWEQMLAGFHGSSSVSWTMTSYTAQGTTVERRKQAPSIQGNGPSVQSANAAANTPVSASRWGESTRTPAKKASGSCLSYRFS